MARARRAVGTVAAVGAAAVGFRLNPQENDVPAYVIANVDVKDPVRYADYRSMVLPTIQKYGGRFLARGGKAETLEGAWQPKRLVIVEFPSVERAKAWWASPEYAEAKALRQATSEGSLVVVEGIEGLE